MCLQLGKYMDFIVCWGVRKDIYDEFSNSSTVPVQNKPFPSTAEYRQLSLEKRAKLLPPPSDDRMEELKIGRKKASRVRVEFYPEVPEMSKRVEKSKQDKSRVLPRGAWNEQKGRKTQAERELSST